MASLRGSQNSLEERLLRELSAFFRTPGRKVVLDPEDMRELFFDATGRTNLRPWRGQREFHSGKKKRHTIETQVVVVRRAKPPEPSRSRAR